MDIPNIPGYDTGIVDGSFLIHRVLHAGDSKDSTAYSDMMTSQGEPTGAIYGCLRVMRSILALPEFYMNDLIVVWDGRPRALSPRRLAIYPDYKKREESSEPPDVVRHRSQVEQQRPLVESMLRLFGIPSINLPRREGDDIVACASRHGLGKIIIVSDDKDYYQLVSPNVHVYRAAIKNPVVLTPDNFEAVMGVKHPSMWRLVAAICGDASDAITGIDKVGITTATKIANKISGIRLDLIQKAIAELQVEDTRSKSRYVKVGENLMTVFRNLELVDLRLESMSPEEQGAFWSEYQRPRTPNDNTILQWFNHYEFKSLLDDYSSLSQPFRKLRPFLCHS